ncbi:hypothetical protein BGX38DRAFT_1205330 [Terfezia claveryi]|nr:hypothetical protein BGX38DRAFT_1205330 [Terfezia claveryi]
MTITTGTNSRLELDFPPSNIFSQLFEEFMAIFPLDLFNFPTSAEIFEYFSGVFLLARGFYVLLCQLWVEVLWVIGRKPVYDSTGTPDSREFPPLRGSCQLLSFAFLLLPYWHSSYFARRSCQINLPCFESTRVSGWLLMVPLLGLNRSNEYFV